MKSRCGASIRGAAKWWCTSRGWVIASLEWSEATHSRDAGGAQRGDFGHRVTQAAEDLVGVLADSRRATRDAAARNGQLDRQVRHPRGSPQAREVRHFAQQVHC